MVLTLMKVQNSARADNELRGAFVRRNYEKHAAISALQIACNKAIQKNERENNMHAHQIPRKDEKYKKECKRNARAHRIAWEVEEYRKSEKEDTCASTE